MADRTIGDLPQAFQVRDTSLLVVEQDSQAMKMTGAQFKEFAKIGVKSYVQEAKDAAQDAANSASIAQQYSGKPPKIINDTWWVWNATSQEYEDTGESARGNVSFATFEIDKDTGLLIMSTSDEYSGPQFSIINGFLEVSIDA